VENQQILVLEDDENLRELLCETLEDEGYQTQGAANGVEAIEKVAAQTFDILIVDVRMEGMSGLEAFAHMQQRGVQLACLVITGYATEEDSIRAIRLGVGDYLRKPFEMGELLIRLARVAAVHQRQREAWQRERRLARHLDWLHRSQAPNPAQQVSRLAQQIAVSLQLDAVSVLEIQMAASLVCQGLCPEGSEHGVSLGLQYWQENWNGSGPQKLAGEAIPLPGRVVRLALLAQQHALAVDEFATRFEGIIDPHLLFALEIGPSQDHERQVRRLNELARGLVSMGQNAEATLALEQAESLAQGSQQGPIQLMLARLEPAPLRLQRLKNLVDLCKNWGPTHEAEILLESGLLLMEGQPEEALPYLRQARERLQQSPQQASLALAEVALWVAGAIPAQWSIWGALALLLQPQHEPRLYPILPWLGPFLLRNTLLDESLDGATLGRFLRHCAAPLVPALAQLTGEQRLQWLRYLQSHPLGVPRSWLESLSQENEAPVKQLALQLVRQKTTQSKPPALHIRSFGTFVVYVAGRPVAEKSYRGVRNKMVFAYLCSSSKMIPEDRLRETFWPEELERGKKGLYNAMFHLRKGLRPDGWSGDCDYLIRNQELVGLDTDLEPWHDLWEVENTLSQVRQLSWTQLHADLTRALSMMESPYLDGCYLDWAVEKRNQLEILLSNALHFACPLAADNEAWESLTDWSQRLFGLEEDNQKVATWRIQGLYHCKGPEAAHRFANRFARKLQYEYHVEPTFELLEWTTRARILGS